MDLVQTVRKEGSRGGRGEFKWEDVKLDAQRENYLGHSLMAPVGRWQQGKDLSWYAKGDKDDEQIEADKRREEIRKVKEAEEDAMAAALGLPPSSRNANMAPLGPGRASDATSIAQPRRMEERRRDGRYDEGHRESRRGHREDRHSDRRRRSRSRSREHGQRDRRRDEPRSHRKRSRSVSPRRDHKSRSDRPREKLSERRRDRSPRRQRSESPKWRKRRRNELDSDSQGTSPSRSPPPREHKKRRDDDHERRRSRSPYERSGSYRRR